MHVIEVVLAFKAGGDRRGIPNLSSERRFNPTLRPCDTASALLVHLDGQADIYQNYTGYQDACMHASYMPIG